jgi:diguanylate cyclase (GGDEF)-like protein
MVEGAPLGEGMNTQQTVDLQNALSQALNRHLPPCLADLLDATTQALKEQRIRANSNSEEQTFTDFIRLCSGQRERIINETLKIIQLRLASPNNQAPEPSSSNEDWNLVDDAEVDELLEMRRLVRILREPLGTLEWRNCARLNRINACISKDLDNPLSLEFLVRTLQACLHLRQQPLAVREVFYSTANVLGSTLLPYLNQLDALFKQYQIEPLSEVRTELNRPPHSTASLHSSAAAPYQAIQQLRAVDSNSQVATTNPASIDLAALQQAIATLQALTPTQQGWSANSFVQQLQQAGAQLSPRQYTDAGLVAELFQHLEQQQVIAAGVKPALRRLMTPVAQAAILEPAAFADPSHPVRATLDKLMRLCDFSEPSNPALEQRVEQLIDGIVSNYRGDSAVFSDCDQQLEQLLAIQQRAYSNNAERVMQYHRGRDKLDVAREQVAVELAQLFGQQAPQVLLEWLDAGWRELLVHELLRQGEHGTEWQDDFDIIRQLHTWLLAETSGATDHVERDYEVDHVLELLRLRTESLLPGQYRHTPILQKLQRQLRGEQPVEMLPCTPLATRKQQPHFDPSQQRWHERVQQLVTGDWLMTDTGQHLQLIWANPATEHYVLADRQGREAGTFTGQQLMQHLANGWIGAPAPDAQGVIQDHLEGIVGKLYRDIAHVRSHDELTGLFNRRSFEASVAQILAGADNYAFIYAHIDQFSLLNSSCGHLAGDSYLKQVASVMNLHMPETAVIARIGGADFAIALDKIDGGQAFQLAEQLRASIESQAFDWQGHSHGVTMSLGLVLTSERHDVINVFCDLQMACNAAKEAGRNRVHIYEEETDGAGTGLMAIAGRVDGIVERGELSLRLQQIAPAPLEHDQLPHYEVLLVMQNDLNLLDFISAAERYNRMTKVDRWVLKTIFSNLALHPKFWEHASGVSINLSGSSLNDDKLLGFIEALFVQYPLPPEKICFELTETTAVANLTKTADFVRHLQKFGCTFSIDDFGTGFSSYEYLKRLPVDFVKIDGGFVKEIERSPSDLAMVRSINEIAHVLGRKTIAEYVETVSIRQRLAEMGIDYVQGYAVERPRPLSELLALC